ncbi:class I SAM-dependent methyltransferase [Cytophaga aurantiaca]|uniref:class I SAM-dependent methyltransferase n=1 Tax=Cytophaga aurantiaca TaxID=29530 RepID=UPI00036767A0|nr:class I SAM-dependent methyltransferase [Cytophaga aurantiaca]
MTPIADPIGSAILDFLSTKNQNAILVESDQTEDEEIPVPYLFRNKEELPEKEVFALSKAHGRILDVGAGSGAHSLILQSAQQNVVALDVSEKCCEAMKLQGITQIVCADFFTFQDTEKFDTILLLMNGFGIAGTLDNLEPLLQQCKSLLKPGGIIIGESADILYLFEEEDGSCSIDLNGNYYGEMNYRMSYQNEVGNWFPWLYISADLLIDIADKAGFQMSEIKHGTEDDFIIFLQLKQ